MKLVLGLILLHLYIAPYNKVEESFNTQAIHDLIYFGPFQLHHFDHFQFPGVVPRTFIGPCILYILTFPYILLSFFISIPKSVFLLLMRASLGFLVYKSIKACRTALYRIYGSQPIEWFDWMYLIQFHFLFWSSRTLPNIFAFIFTNYAYSFHLIGSLSHSKDSVKSSLNALALLVGTAVIFRSEVSVLGFFIISYDLIHRRYTLLQGIKMFFISFSISLCSTLVIDSWFWQKSLYWPELIVFLFNTVKNGSIDYGISPWHYYFTHLLPRIAPVSLLLSLISLFTSKKTTSLVIPAFLYVLVYSVLPHKEWRFIFYVTTPMNMSASLFLSNTVKGFKKILVNGIFLLFVLQSFLFVWISSWNYPGGIALDKVHDFGPFSIYIDAYTAMTGASRFLERCPSTPYPWNLKESCLITYDKNETQSYFGSYSHILTNDPRNRSYSSLQVQEIIYGYNGIGFRNTDWISGFRNIVKKFVNLEFRNVEWPIKMDPLIWILVRNKFK